MKLSEKLDELYKPEKQLDKLLEGMESSADLVQLKDTQPEELNISEADASQKPVVRLVDMIISEGILSRGEDRINAILTPEQRPRLHQTFEQRRQRVRDWLGVNDQEKQGE